MIMKKIVLLVVISLLQLQGLCHPTDVKVFYVKPIGPTTECSSGDSPCHSLQYYANHSNFTNNSRFLFLKGEHHLDSVVRISNVANLSLVGASSGVKIICNGSHRSGFLVKRFTRLIIENMTISKCHGHEGATLFLSTGSEVILNSITISSRNDATAIDVVGSFVISNSTFLEPQGSNLQVTYSLCNRPSYFYFRNNTAAGTKLSVAINCSDISVLISDSIFNSNEVLSLLFYALTNNSVLIDNSIFRGDIEVSTCLNCSNEIKGNCSNNFIKFIGVTVNSDVVFTLGYSTRIDCPILIEDSVFSGLSSGHQVSITVAPDCCKGIIQNDMSVHVVLDNVTFESYSNRNESALFLIRVAILIVNSTFENNIGSAIQSYTSKLIFHGDNVFKNNSASVGGGVQMLSSSHMHLRSHTRILFEGNHADYVGGAIYTDYKASDSCFFHTDDLSSPNNPTKINFIKNTANVAGSSLYGGINKCCTNSSCKEFCGIFMISNTETDPSAVASDPDNVCFCDNIKNQPDCSNLNRLHVTHAYPGQDFSIRVAVVGGFLNGVVPGAIHAYFDTDFNATLGAFQSLRVSNKLCCKSFNYSVKTTERSMVMFRISQDQSFFWGTGDPRAILFVYLNLMECPLGFSLSSATGTCVCDPVINTDNIECNIDDQTILRPANSWIGFVRKFSTPSNKSGVIFHSNCPIRYCRSVPVNISSDSSDSQCEPYRTGLLCGECEDGYSLTLGTPKCAQCYNTYLLFILPLALAGLLLVAALFLLNLTVTEGSINGLIFYANVIGIGMNQTILFSGEASYLYTFFAWLNLDLGISTCLFDGMDGYTETWLQFVFPVYLWTIILVITLLYRKFPTLANKFGGENAVKVLATLLLLSYTKLQRTVVTIMSFTWLEYPDGVVRYVWLHDANVDFFKGKHLYLGIAGILVLVFLIVPYTLCLTFFQQLQACSGHRFFQWVNKLKPVFDSYAGPYKDKYRFWTGLLLLVRTLLIILFTINTRGSIDFNLLIISLVSITLLMAHSNGLYKKWPYNYLESFFYLQLGLLAASLAYTRHNHGNVTAVANVSLGLTLAAFLAIIGFLVWHRFKDYCYHRWGYAEVVEEDSSIGERLLD